MNKRIGIFYVTSLSLILLTSTIAFPSQAFAQDFSTIEDFQPASKNPQFVSGQVIVGLDQLDSSFNAKAKTIGGEVIDSNDTLKALLIQVPGNAEDAFIKAISKNPNVKFAEKNYIVKALSTPNDPYWNNYQWNMKKIQADDAWDALPINPAKVIVAVADTGVQWNHIDLADNIWDNPGDDCVGGIDDDENGFVDDCRGWDFINNDANPMDEDGHGTHVAGTVGSVTDNNVGVASVAGSANVKIMPVRVLGPNGGTDWQVADGVTYAAENGANVINLSLGCYCPSLLLTKAAIDHAYIAHDILVFAAAGNDNINADSHYPSAYPSAMSVAATNKDDNKASYSNYGNTVEISAPGGDGIGGPASKTRVLSTYPTNSFAYGYGTSMATPHVAGVAALILSINSSLYGENVRDILKDNSDGIVGFGLGAGRVNAYAALNAVPPPELIILVPDVVGLTQAAAEASITAANLSVGTVSTASSDTITAGNVISQNPFGGVEVVEGYPVSLVISLGPATTTVPNVIGFTQADAETAIVAASLTVGTVTEIIDAASAGTVIGQNPSGGETAAINSEVNLTVSLGPATTTTLSVSVSTDLPTYPPKSFAYISVNVTDGVDTVSGASVTLTVTDPNGGDKTLSGTTDNNGEVTFKYRISPKAPSGTFDVNASANAPGFSSGNGSTSFDVE